MAQNLSSAIPDMLASDTPADNVITKIQAIHFNSASLRTSKLITASQYGKIKPTNMSAIAITTIEIFDVVLRLVNLYTDINVNVFPKIFKIDRNTASNINNNDVVVTDEGDSKWTCEMSSILTVVFDMTVSITIDNCFLERVYNIKYTFSSYL